MLDLFSGIGGFHKGFEQAGYEFEWVGFSEIDKYASAVYKHRFPNAKELGDITAIRPKRDLPSHIDILCGGFPCQAFSVAGKRKGFNDTRGTLFFEIARILRYYVKTGKPIDCFVLENVKGLLGHDSGRTFATIYQVLADIGYTVECQLLNTSWVLPQNRERIYIVGHIGRGSRSKVFPIKKSGTVLNKWKTKVASTLQHPGHSGGNYRGMNLIQVGNVDKKGHNSIWGRVYSIDGVSSTLNSEGGGMGAKTGLYEVKAFLTPNRKEKRQDGRRMKEDKEPMFTLNSQDQHGVMVREATKKEYDERKTAIRRLTPKECERLQGFPDDWTAYAGDQKISDTQRYKMCGNAVSVPIVQLVARSIYDNLRMDS
jgi:DNA (cytosine-5)-methyltransferase 1